MQQQQHLPKPPFTKPSPSDQDRQHLQKPNQTKQVTRKKHPQPLPFNNFSDPAETKVDRQSPSPIPANRTPYKAPEWGAVRSSLPPDSAVSVAPASINFIFGGFFFLLRTYWAFLPKPDGERIDLRFFAALRRLKAEWGT